MNNKIYTTILISAMVAMFSSDVSISSNALKQNNQEIMILSTEGIASFHTADGSWEIAPFPSDFPALRYETISVSPDGKALVFWDKETLLREGIWLVEFEGSTFSVNNVMLSEQSFEFVQVQWPFGERFAVIEAGILLPDTNPLRHIRQITAAWLVTIDDKTAVSWYWDCGEVIHFLEKDGFGIHCPLAEYAQGIEPNVMFLTPEGPQESVDWNYEILHRRDRAFDEVPWMFSPQMDKVAFDEIHIGVTVYNVYGQKLYEDTQRDINSIVYRFAWTSSGQYLAIVSSCSRRDDKCVEIINADNAKSVWDSTFLRHWISVESIIWTADEKEFFVLGHLYGEFPGFYIWQMSMIGREIARWERPASFVALLQLTSS